MREKIQHAASSSIIEGNYEGIIDVAPRVGKSKIVVDALRELPKSKILITVPFNVIIDSWKAEFKKWDLDKHDITIVNQRYIPNEDFDLVITDEIHTLSDNQIEKLKGSKILGLSGSISNDTKYKLNELLDLNSIFKYSIENAIDDGIISNFKITVVYCNLSRTKKVKITTKKKEYMQTEFARYESLTKLFNKQAYLSRDMTVNPKVRAMNSKLKIYTAGRRANALYNFPTKIALAKKIIDKQDRALIFTTRTKVADQLAHSYHSKSKKDNYQKFVDGDLDKLAVAQMIQMGVTIPNLKTGVFHQIQSSEESAVQKVLRMCNLEDEKEANIYICCYSNTVDESWVNSALKLFPPDKIKHITSKTI
jgi:superfamily II DNA or RNA helicase